MDGGKSPRLLVAVAHLTYADGEFDTKPVGRRELLVPLLMVEKTK